MSADTVTARTAPRPDRDARLERITALLDPVFLAGIGWDAGRRMVAIPRDHPALGYPICKVAGCDAVATRSHGLCQICHGRWTGVREQMSVERFWRVGQASKSIVGEVGCAVTGCGRPALSSPKQLCRAHHRQRTRQLGLAMTEFLADAAVVALAGFGACRVAGCPRERHSAGRLRMCRAHEAKWAAQRRQAGAADVDTWCREQGAMADRGQIGLQGLPDLVVAELLLGLQLRSATDATTRLVTLRYFIHKLRTQRCGSVLQVQGIDHDKNTYSLMRALTSQLRRALSSPQEERRHDVWDATVFGHTGTIDFTGIRQAWLREAVKEWVFEDMPTHRGRAVTGLMRAVVDVAVRLSDSLHVQREDHGEQCALLGRADIVAFLNRLAYLESIGQLSRDRRARVCRDLARVLRDIRAIGLTGPGRPAAGLADEFACRRGDVPQAVTDDGPGRALPDDVLRQLHEALPVLQARFPVEVRVAVELLMDTGRRPDEVRQLPLDCLAQDGDGKHVLVYCDFKEHRRDRRLPITDATAAVIRAQQVAVRQRFPDTDPQRLALLPAASRNPRGERRLTQDRFNEAHRAWVASLPPIRSRDGTPVPAAAMVPYAYRHSYAQRHADAGVPVDVLRDLMGHRSTETTQLYYRVTEKRTRAAIDKVAAVQFDRHGTRIWRQAQVLLDDERARLRIGQVSVPYGTCTEPTNVQAGGQGCPFRFRCVGCGHFRTDASYLPDLKAYLQDLLRDRERALAATDLDEWARADAAPSTTEIRQVRELVRRVETTLDDLTPDERQQIADAVAVVRATRTVVDLGIPRIGAPRPDEPAPHPNEHGDPR